MRQLNSIGWMHNRVRMITAMFLSKDLLVDWRLGEEYFMKNLIDGDFSSNNGGWQWVFYNLFFSPLPLALMHSLTFVFLILLLNHVNLILMELILKNGSQNFLVFLLI